MFVRSFGRRRFYIPANVSYQRFFGLTTNTNNNNNNINSNNVFSNSNRIYTPEQGYYWKSPYALTELPNQTLDEYIWENVHLWDKKVAIECGVTKRKYTYGEMRDSCATLAVHLLSQYKLAYGDVIAIYLPTIPEFIIALLAASEAGLISTLINPKYSPGEAVTQLKMSNAKLIFGLASDIEKLQTIRQLYNPQLEIVTVRVDPANQSIPIGTSDFYELIRKQNFDYSILKEVGKNRSIHDVCILPYSSGTTGLPKGVMLTHLNKTSNIAGMNGKCPNESLIIPTSDSHQDCLICVLPLFHIYGLTVTVLSKLRLGCKFIFLPHFNIDELLDSVLAHQVNILYLVPHVMVYWASYERATRKHSQYVRAVLSAAAPIGSSDYERFKEKCPNVELKQAYGLTETSPIASLTPDGCSNYATIGFPISHTEFKISNIDDPTFRGLGTDEVGELLIRGPLIMKGYLNNEEATANTIVKDSWFRTGDLGSYDTNGYFYIKDRLKELIKVKGFQVAPAEIEELLRHHPQILDAAVIGVPHSKYGEVPKAFVVKKPSVKLNETDIQEYVAGKLVSYKHLVGGVQFLDVIPKTDSGKYLRKNLKLL